MADPLQQSIDVVAGVLFHGGRILLCQRHERAAFPLKWEFPGGKIEAGESGETALRRELEEELTIQVGALRPMFFHRHCYASGLEVKLHFFHIFDYRGELKNMVFQTIRWVKINDIENYDILEGDIPFVQQLRAGNVKGASH